MNILEKTWPETPIKQAMLQCMLVSAIHSNKDNPGIFGSPIFIGSSENHHAFLALEELKKQGLVENYSEPHEDEKYDEGYGCSFVNCRFYPKKVTSFLKKIWKPKKEIADKLVTTYKNLADLTENFLNNPSTNDTKSNDYYQELANKARVLFEKTDPSFSNLDLHFFPVYCYIPFENLFSAGKTISRSGLKPQDYIDEIWNFYGNLVEIKKSLDVESYLKKETSPKDITRHIFKLRNKETVNRKRRKVIVPIVENSEKIIWEDVIVKFKNQYEIQIFIKNEFKGTFSHERLGFYKENSTEKKPDEQWKFLQKISTTKGIFNPNQYLAAGMNIEQINNTRANYRMIISKLSQQLKKLFTLENDPFKCEDKIYKSIFKLEPDPDLRGPGEVYINRNNML